MPDSKRRYVLTFVNGDVRECEYDPATETFTHVLNTSMTWARDDPRIQKYNWPDCCQKARKGDWNEGAGGELTCPTCGQVVGRFRQ